MNIERERENHGKNETTYMDHRFKWPLNTLIAECGAAPEKNVKSFQHWNAKV